jgi:hypothetical protein
MVEWNLCYASSGSKWLVIWSLVERDRDMQEGVTWDVRVAFEVVRREWKSK